MSFKHINPDHSASSEGSMPNEGETQASVQDTAATADLGLVAYTDGSTRPTNPGFTGWGVHGYIYPIGDTEEKPMVGDVYTTDYGYLTKNQLGFKFGSSPVKHVVPREYIEFLGSSLSTGTNNQAEMEAVHRVIRYALNNKIKRVTIFADSEYTRQGLTQWCKGWENNGWRTKEDQPVKNQEEWKKLYSLYKQYREEGGKISIHWVKGHNGRMGNVQADILAGIASGYSMTRTFYERELVFPAKGYWKSEVERHPLLNCKRVYFNSVSSANVPGTYFQADTGAADHLIGKRIPETGLSVLRLLEPYKLMEDIKTRQYEIAREFNTVIMLKLDRVYDKDIFPYLSEHGGNCLTQGKGNMNLNWFDKKPVCVEVGTTGLSMRAIDHFNHLEEMLDKFVKLKEAGFPKSDSGNPVNVHDVTAEFYDYAEVQVRKETVLKCTLKPKYGVGFTDMSLNIKEPHNGSEVEVKVPLILGTDMPPRNNLKKIEGLNPRVYLITWRESQQSIRYATVIVTDVGYGIWSNFFADRIFFSNPVQQVNP
jgi:ribonuclease HI